jgi:hypothetical protein
VGRDGAITRLLCTAVLSSSPGTSNPGGALDCAAASVLLNLGTCTPLSKTMLLPGEAQSLYVAPPQLLRAQKDVSMFLQCSLGSLLRAETDVCLFGFSALRDRRFDPVSHREIAQLSCTVSLLCAFEPAQSHLDWSVGTHGLIIDFFGALLL